MCKTLLNSDKADSKLVIHYKSCIQSFVFHEITKKEVTRHINAMKTHTAPGLDGISSKFIKLAKLIVAPFLHNCSITVLTKTFSLKILNYPLSLLFPKHHHLSQ